MRFHMKPASGIAVALILVPLLAGVRPAHSQPSTASITGAVVSLDGAGLPGSAVTVTPADGSPAVRVVAGERGVFRVRSLAAGTYAVRAEATGFAPTSL